MKSTFDRIESRLQAVIENRLPWAKHKNLKDLLAKRLVDALRDQVRQDELGNWIAPDDYMLSLNPHTFARLQKNTELNEHLARTVEMAAREAQIRFLLPVTIRLVADEALVDDEIRAACGYKQETLGDTASLPAQPAYEPAEALPTNAFLIVAGNQVYPLRQAVINIGRRKDNHLVVDDARVSRSHAQIRAIQGNFRLFDLNSTGGTYVNNQRITQWTLQPGDVISLAGATLIYGEDNPANLQPPDGSTQEISH